MELVCSGGASGNRSSSVGVMCTVIVASGMLSLCRVVVYGSLVLVLIRAVCHADVDMFNVSAVFCLLLQRRCSNKSVQ